MLLIMEYSGFWAGYITDGGFITSETDTVTDGTKVLISAPGAIFSKSLYVFTTGIPIQPVYIQAPPGNLTIFPLAYSCFYPSP